MAEIDFNVNHYAKVKLTPLGEAILKKKHENLMLKLKKHCDDFIEYPFNLKLDEDGYYKDQLWCIMQTFGNYVNLSGQPPFETNIILCKE